MGGSSPGVGCWERETLELCVSSSEKKENKQQCESVSRMDSQETDSCAFTPLPCADQLFIPWWTGAQHSEYLRQGRWCERQGTEESLWKTGGSACPFSLFLGGRGRESLPSATEDTLHGTWWKLMHLVEHFLLFFSLVNKPISGTFLSSWTDGHTMSRSSREMHQGSWVQLLSTHLSVVWF